MRLSNKKSTSKIQQCNTSSPNSEVKQFQNKMLTAMFDNCHHKTVSQQTMQEACRTFFGTWMWYYQETLSTFTTCRPKCYRTPYQPKEATKGGARQHQRRRSRFAVKESQRYRSSFSRILKSENVHPYKTPKVHKVNSLVLHATCKDEQWADDEADRQNELHSSMRSFNPFLRHLFLQLQSIWCWLAYIIGVIRKKRSGIAMQVANQGRMSTWVQTRKLRHKVGVKVTFHLTNNNEHLHIFMAERQRNRKHSPTTIITARLCTTLEGQRLGLRFLFSWYRV